MTPIRTSRELSRAVGRLRFGPPVACVYNPLAYAQASHEHYLRRYARTGIEVLLLGMNPGPYGMVQTGVPFGEVEMVREWLGIVNGVQRPRRVHPRRPILGFRCRRSEVSGRRLWGWARDRFGTPEEFFRRFFVWNYCPLAFLEDSGRNLTPDRLRAAEKERLFPHCDAALRRIAAHLQPARVVGVGTFAAERARSLFHQSGPAVGVVLHPSPASPRANRGWATAAEQQLRDQGVAI